MIVPSTNFKELLHRITPFPHYYGDVVRLFFLGAGATMVITLPFLVDRLPIPLILAIAIIVAIDIFAGITNPVQTWTIMIDVGISSIGLAAFTYYTVESYLSDSVLFFTVNYILAILFFFACYFSIKTLRGYLVPEKNDRRLPS